MKAINMKNIYMNYLVIIRKTVIINLLLSAAFLQACSGTAFQTLLDNLNAGGEPSTPSVTSVSSVDYLTVTVTFDAELDSASAAETANYVITGLNVFSASLDGKTVTLSTSAQSERDYDISISSVKGSNGETMNAFSGTFTGSSPAAGDTTAPTLVSAVAVNNTTVELTFSEAVNEKDAEDDGNYSIDNSLVVVSAVRSGSNNALVTLTVTAQSTVSYTVTASGISDLAGNTISSSNTATFDGDAKPYIFTSGGALSDADGAGNTDTLTIFPDLKHVNVYLSEEVTLDSATNTANFIIYDDDDESITLAVTAASLNFDTDVSAYYVSLTTDDQIGSTKYRVYAINLFDLNGNRIANDNNNGTFTTDPVPLSDTTRPLLLGAVATSTTTIKVNFNEEVSAATSECDESVTVGSCTAIYDVLDSSEIATSFTVIKAVKSGASVILTLDAPTAGEALKIEVADVEDTSGNIVNPSPSITPESFTSDAAPQLSAAQSLGSSSVQLTFNEAVSAASAECADSTACAAIYTITGGAGLIVSSAYKSATDRVVLVTSSQLTETYTVSVADGTVADLNGNTIDTSAKSASFDGTSTDQTAPALLDVTVTSATTIAVSFTEALESAGAETAANYSLSGASTTAPGVQSASLSGSVVTLTLDADLDSDTYTLSISNVQDSSLNTVYPNPSESLFTTDFNVPTLTAAYQYDCNGNGSLDRITLHFNKSISDSTVNDSTGLLEVVFSNSSVNQSAYTVDNVTGGSALLSCASDGSLGNDPGIENDNYVTLVLADTTLTGSDGKALTLTASGSYFQDSAGNPWASVSFAAGDTEMVDEAPPILLSATADQGEPDLRILISEPVYADTGASNSTIDASFISYTDGSANGVGGLDDYGSICSANDGTDQSTCESDTHCLWNSSLSTCEAPGINGDDGILTMKSGTSGGGKWSDPADGSCTDGEFCVSDLFVDEVLPSTAFYDAAGNQIDMVSYVTVIGVIKPYVLGVSQTAASKIRVTFSEAMDSAVVDPAAAAGYCINDDDSVSVNSFSTCSAGSPLAVNSVAAINTRVYEITMSSNLASGTNYSVFVDPTMTDVNDGAALVSPTFGTFVGDEPPKILQIESVSDLSFEITFSKPMKGGGETACDSVENNANYQVTCAGSTLTVTDAIRQTDTSKVLITHAENQGIAFCSVIAHNGSNGVNGSCSGTGLAATAAAGGVALGVSPKDRGSFGSFLIENHTDFTNGPLFEDPFGDGTSFSFAFVYNDRVYLGPNDSNTGAFRFEADGANGIAAAFTPPDVCDNADSDTLDGLFDDPCTDGFGNGDDLGPQGVDGIGSFVSGNMNDGTEILLIGPSDLSSTVKYIYWTTDVDSNLDLFECALPNPNPSGILSVETMTIFNDSLWVGEVSDQAAHKPILKKLDLTLADGSCNTSGSISGKNIDYVTDAGHNYMGIDAISGWTSPGGVKYLYIANSSGVARSSTFADGDPATDAVGVVDGSADGWLDMTPSAIGQTNWRANTLQVASAEKLRPGEKGVPFIVDFDPGVADPAIYMARNKTGTSPELWRCDDNCTATSDWSLVFDATNLVLQSDLGDSTGATADPQSIGMVQVAGDRLYIGIDSTADRARIFYYDAGDNAGVHPTVAADFIEEGRVDNDCSSALYTDDWLEGGIGGYCSGEVFFSSAIISKSGTDYLYLAIGDETNAIRVMRKKL